MACFVIESNFEDVGFGDPEINFSATPFSAPAHIDAVTAAGYANLGFGSLEDITLEISDDTSNTYVNYFDLNHGDKIIEIDPTLSTELTIVRLVRKVNKGITIVQPGEKIVTFPTGLFDLKPTVVCQNYRHDASFYTKNVNKNHFIIVNNTKVSQKVAYVANGFKREKV